VSSEGYKFIVEDISKTRILKVKIIKMSSGETDEQ